MQNTKYNKVQIKTHFQQSIILFLCYRYFLRRSAALQNTNHRTNNHAMCPFLFGLQLFKYFGLLCPPLIYCEDFVNKVLGAVVVVVLSANWNEFIRPKLLLKTLCLVMKNSCRMFFLSAFRCRIVVNVTCVIVHRSCQSRQRKIKTGWG